MRHCIVISAMRLCHLRITTVMRLLRIVATMAVMMVRHVGAHIRLIVVQVHRFGFRVIRWEIAIVIRRRPNGVVRMTEHIPHRRAFDKYRTNNVVIAVQIAITDHLYIQRICLAFSYQSSYILEYTRSQACLDEERVVITAMSLNNTQIVNPSVAVEVEVVDHVAARVEQLLKLLDRTALCEGGCHRIEVQIETRIGIVVRHYKCRHFRYFGRRGGHLGRINGLYRSYRLCRRHFGVDTGNPTTRHG